MTLEEHAKALAEKGDAMADALSLMQHTHGLTRQARAALDDWDLAAFAFRRYEHEDR